MIEGITLQQRNKIIDNFVIPYVDLIKETLEELSEISEINKETALKDLLSLIVKDKQAYPADIIKLDSRELVAQEDFLLKIGIQEILKNASKDQFQQVYQALYTLFHQCRLNKSPDSQYIDEQNTVAANNADPYNLTVTKLGKLSQRCVEKKWETYVPSDIEVEKTVVDFLKKIILDIENTEKIDTPISTEPSIVIKNKRSIDSLDEPSPQAIDDLFKLLEEKGFPTDLQPSYKKSKLENIVNNEKPKNNTQEDDFSIARRLQNEENEKVARQIQEKEDHDFALSLSKQPRKRN